MLRGEAPATRWILYRWRSRQFLAVVLLKQGAFQGLVPTLLERLWDIYCRFIQGVLRAHYCYRFWGFEQRVSSVLLQSRVSSAPHKVHPFDFRFHNGNILNEFSHSKVFSAISQGWCWQLSDARTPLHLIGELRLKMSLALHIVQGMMLLDRDWGWQMLTVSSKFHWSLSPPFFLLESPGVLCSNL